MLKKYIGGLSAIMLTIPLLITVIAGYILSSQVKTSSYTREYTAARSAPSKSSSAANFTTHAAVQNEKAFTLMIYMNGSDLESKYAAGTGDLNEMFESGFDDESMNVVVFTGGCKKWHTEGIPNGANAIYQLKNNELLKIADAGAESMGEPSVLAGFVKLTQQIFPAKKQGLILWNHGGGAVIGYGADERYEDNPEKAVMKLRDIDDALASSELESKLEFIGFDTCLMSTIEMANIAQRYANYLVASEEVEPEQGWDYRFLGEVTPEMDGGQIGRIIVDYYGNYYENSELEDFSTLSLTNLSKIDNVVDAFENFSHSAGYALNSGQYNLLSRARSRTRSFGSGGEDGETDMVDIYEMAMRLGNMFPVEAQTLVHSLLDAVEYRYESREESIGGLSVYFPFYNKENLDYNIGVYTSMNQLPNYTSFISNFSAILTENPKGNRPDSLPPGAPGRNAVTPDQAENLSDIRLTTWMKTDDGYCIQLNDKEAVINAEGKIEYDNGLATINGYPACFYDTNNSDVKRYTIPVKLNGDDANLIAIYGDKYPDGKILGAIPTNNDVFNTIDKKLISVKDGDKISMRYYAVMFDGNEKTTDVKETETWISGEEFEISGGLTIGVGNTDGDKYIQKLNLIDTHNNNNYVDIAVPLEIRQRKRNQLFP